MKDDLIFLISQADPPDVSRIPVNDALGVTVVLLTCSYRGHEFVRVGYFINNEYTDAELRENPPAQPQFDKVQRNILGDKPRVTRFKINWDDSGASTSNNGNQDEMEAQSIDDVRDHEKPTSSLGFTENTQNSMEVMWSRNWCFCYTHRDSKIRFFFPLTVENFV